MNSALKTSIAKIVEAVPSSDSFNTYLVIGQIKYRHLPLYEEFVRERELGIAHAEIACVVRDGKLVCRSPKGSLSRTANGTYVSFAD